MKTDVAEISAATGIADAQLLEHLMLCAEADLVLKVTYAGGVVTDGHALERRGKVLAEPDTDVQTLLGFKFLYSLLATQGELLLSASDLGIFSDAPYYAERQPGFWYGRMVQGAPTPTGIVIIAHRDMPCGDAYRLQVLKSLLLFYDATLARP